MNRWFNFPMVACLVLGVAAGGGLVAWTTQPKIEAASVDRIENFAMATGQLAGDLECVILLDSIGGDLTVFALNPQNGQFTARFDAKVFTDMNIDASRNPKFLVSSGVAQMRAAGAQFADSVIYVAETTTGNLAAYAIPFNRSQLNAARAPMTGQLRLMQVVPFRQQLVR